MRTLLLIKKKMNEEIIMSIRQGAFIREGRLIQSVVGKAFTTGETKGTTLQKWRGCSSENFENTRKRYPNLVLWACPKLISTLRVNQLNNIIIHSKYFPDSDWLKEHA